MKKRILFLNLPYKNQVVRRYMCSYDSPESLLPPIELISLASVARQKGFDVTLLDAIADQKNEIDVISFIGDYKPHYIVSLTGFECYEEDVDCIKELKTNFPEVSFITFGYYATQFPEETLRHSLSDILILGEPDVIFNDFLINENRHEVSGICYLEEGEFIKNGNSKRIKEFDKIPIPAYDLLHDKYYEPFVERPYGMIQTMRGCPYTCNYCVKSFGSLTTSLTSDEIINHIQIWIDLHQVKTIRFIDDTFTLNRKRVIEICDKIIENKIKISWLCLSRLDNLDEELVEIMVKSGCKRIYLGIESGSTSVLESLNKKMDVQKGLDLLRKSKKLGIEFAGFFLGSLPSESEEEFKESIRFATKSRINFVSYNPLTPYPGTSLFVKHREEINFSIYPYKNEWKDKEIYTIYEGRKKKFYTKFYFRLSFITINYKLLFKYIKFVPPMAVGLVKSLFNKNIFIIGGIRRNHR